MSPARRWQDVKAEAHRRHPELTDPQLRARADAELDAQIAGYHLAELRKLVGKTQAEVAALVGVSQSRISQIENGNIEAMELETLRAYAAALGGRVDVTVSIGPHAVKVA
ncbi:MULTISPECIES: helix-turn-helix transcriptional regulator [unclassified Streptomyces]|uniref:helix-turn-helix domain-containing protein n=1 Tax=unclassified Streptomyces TaxID=2593676 RepID=UPI000C27DB65|nr:helix-turn-helix transcriptional regulator [Streptomyces sp. CB01373]PJM97429.1 transcriptional regulator [Streptomyces sp. CB01373]